MGISVKALSANELAIHMISAITGTPGVGKTTVAEILRKRGYKVLDLNKIIKENNLEIGYDEERNTKIVDIEALDSKVIEELENGDVFLEGHLSHLLPLKQVIVLRCDPLELEKRLKTKNWSQKKIKENVAAEILDAIKIEARESQKKIYEVDTSSISPEEVTDKIEQIVKGIYNDPKIAWLEKYEYLLFDDY